MTARTWYSNMIGAGAIVLGIAGSVSAADWGTLTGRFVYDGKAPAPAQLSITKDPDICGKPPALTDESLVVAKDGGLANVVVWVRDKNVQVNPDAKIPGGKAVIDNKHCRFDPHVVLSVIGKPMELENSDPIAHNTKVDLHANSAFNNVIPANSKQDLTALQIIETTPVEIACNIHPWMKGVLVVLRNPYGAVSGSDGKFEIKDLPAGKELDLQVWQEKAGNVANIKVGGTTTDSHGRFKYTIKPGANDLGDIKLDPTLFNK